MEPADMPSLLGLPAEVIQHILSYCSPNDLTRAALACHRLCSQAYDDRLWQGLVNSNLPRPISDPRPLTSFRKLYIAHHPHWFLPRHRLWFADSEPSGKLLFSRYDSERGCIEAHAVAARKGTRTWEFWDKDSEVMIHHFNPTVAVDLTRPVLKLDVDSLKTDDQPKNSPRDSAHSTPTLYGKETLMETFADAGLYGSFMLCRTLPEPAITENTQVWPPLRFKAGSRTRCESNDGFKSVGHRPTTLDEVSESTFRLRKWVEYTGRRASPSLMSFSSSASGLAAAFGIGGAQLANTPDAPEFSATMRIRVPEDITTYASIPPSAYTPTPEKPWQGIWCGDYSGHGCEFLLLTQPDKDEERPLPGGMDWLQPWFNGSAQRRGSNASVRTTSTEGETDFSGAVKDPDADDEEVPGIPAQGDSIAFDAETQDHHDNSNDQDDITRKVYPNHAYPLPEASSSQQPTEDFTDYPGVPSGRLEAIKLTGDPNIPRGEYTWIAPDIGNAGLIRIADEAVFRGARVVKSAGHMAGRGFRGASYTPSQLIMISHDTVAQFWEGFGHISYFKRVDLGELSKSY